MGTQNALFSGREKVGKRKERGKLPKFNFCYGTVKLKVCMQFGLWQLHITMHPPTALAVKLENNIKRRDKILSFKMVPPHFTLSVTLFNFRRPKEVMKWCKFCIACQINFPIVNKLIIVFSIFVTSSIKNILACRIE